MAEHIADALLETLSSTNVPDNNLEPANVVDVIDSLSRNAYRIATAITDQGASPGRDDSGNMVGCLTEAVMSLSENMGRVASAINFLAECTKRNDY